LKHIKQMTEVLSEYYDWDPRRLPFFANMLSAIIRSRSVNMQKVAESIEGAAMTESNYRRIQRLFQKQAFDYEMTARLLSTILPDEPWVLAMDRTNWKLGDANVNVLVLAVAHEGMAIPLLWKFLTKEDDEGNTVGKRGNSDYKERQALMEQFVSLFGVKRIKALTADREFIGKEWFEWLMDKDIPFVIRIRNNLLLDQDQLDARTVEELFAHVRKNEFCAFGETTLFGQKLQLGGIRSSKSDEALVVVSNRPMDKETIAIYRKRWEIETMFGALKSRGFNFEESKISEESKVEKLMALLSLSFMWSILAGEYRQEQSPIALKKKSEPENLPHQESFQAWTGVAQKRIGQFKAQKEGIFRVARAA
jgi:hypothetical protein